LRLHTEDVVAAWELLVRRPFTIAVWLAAFPASVEYAEDAEVFSESSQPPDSPPTGAEAKPLAPAVEAKPQAREPVRRTSVATKLPETANVNPDQFRVAAAVAIESARAGPHKHTTTSARNSNFDFIGFSRSAVTVE